MKTHDHILLSLFALTLFVCPAHSQESFTPKASFSFGPSAGSLSSTDKHSTVDVIGFGVEFKFPFSPKLDIQANVFGAAEACIFCENSPSNEMEGVSLLAGKTIWKKGSYLGIAGGLGVISQSGPGELISEGDSYLFSEDEYSSTSVILPSLNISMEAGIRFKKVSLGIDFEPSFTTNGPNFLARLCLQISSGTI